MDVDFKFLEESEMARVRAKNRGVSSFHEGAGVLFEEVEEFWDEVKKKPKHRNKANALKELVQIAGVVRRIAEDLGLIEYARTAGLITEDGRILTNDKNLDYTMPC